MKQKVATGSNKGRGQRPAWQHGFVAAAGILTRLISVHSCQVQGSPCVCEGQQPRPDCASVTCSYAARAGPRRITMKWKLFTALRKRKQIAEHSKREWDFTPHYCERSHASSDSVTYREVWRVCATGVVYQQFLMVFIIITGIRVLNTDLWDGRRSVDIAQSYTPCLHIKPCCPSSSSLTSPPCDCQARCWSEFMNEVPILN